MENYEKKYKDALKKAKDLHDNHALGMPFIYETCEQIFPELKESEDDRIRKEIIQFLRLPHSQFVGKRNHEEWIAWLEKHGEQKPVDKVEPKFKVGDWITNSNGILRHIVDVDKTGYQTDNGWLTHEDYENNFHLWTIEDAKDGDVLASKKGCPFIYKKSDDTKALFYCCVGIDNDFCIGDGIVYCGYKESAKPATKDQRDMLFSKMKEAGYMWDAEKKELKKIEQKPDFCHHEVDLSDCSEEYRKAYYDGWNNCNQQHAQLKAEQKPAWSEEDENGLGDALWAIKQARTIAKDENEMGGLWYAEKWLKSLKERMKGE